MHVSLTPRLEKLIQEKVEAGLYNNASEVVREALRQMEKREAAYQAKLAWLKGAIAEGEADLAAGRYVEIADEAELQKFFDEL